MKLIVGLGNPGDSYKNTRHNVGFIYIDSFAQSKNSDSFKKFENAEYSDGFLDGHKYLLIKPQTYMNLSGTCVKKFLTFFKLQITDLLIIYDEADLDIGEYKLSLSRGSGGHNGIKNIMQELCTNAFLKLRIGISNKLKKSLIIEDFVMGKLNEQDKQHLKILNSTVYAIIEDFILGLNADQLMNKYNTKKT